MKKPHGDMSSLPCLLQNGFSSTVFQGIKHSSCLLVSSVKITIHNTSQVVKIMSGHFSVIWQTVFCLMLSFKADVRVCVCVVNGEVISLGCFSSALPEVVDCTEGIHLLSFALFKYA